jgi:UDP-GlcNAc:undecaprenyl-phosphate/decaprenyl-phosphate GlcNAc-1-phosphate transferase
MLQAASNPFVVGSVAFVLAIFSTFVVRKLARQFGFIARPTNERWHKRPTAMMGGVAIFLTTVVMYLLFAASHTTESWIILGGSALLFLVGLIDDILRIKPYQKLFGQLIGAAVIIGNGLTLNWTDFPVINIAITAFWLVGITNAVNLLDNMDGLAAGIAAIAALTLAVGLGSDGRSYEVLLLTAFVGALLGFLVFNFNPASIFMGDCGSMFVGFFLASSVLLNRSGGNSRNIISVLAVPALILLVPIFDTTFVTVLRKIWGRKASQGGRDHTSHRLVALGLSERAAVLMLYAFAFLSGSIALLVRELRPTQSIALIVFFALVLTIVGVYLSKVKVYEKQQEDLALQNRAVFGFLLNLSHKRRVFEIILDVFLIALSYYASYVLIFGPIEETGNWELFLKTLPLLIILKLFSFLAFGVYRGIWRYTSVGDFVNFAKGVFFGSALSVIAILLLYRFENFSRTVFILDALILFAALCGSRMAFRLFRELLPTPMRSSGRRVLIYGAGDGGEMVLRELYNNPGWNYAPVGFVDDDPLKKDKLIHGLKVYGGNGSLAQICRENAVEEVLISSTRIPDERLREIRRVCNESEVSLKRAQIKIEPLDFD